MWEILFIKINAIKFLLSEDIFYLWTQSLFIHEKHTEWNLDTKVKDFMKLFHVSWNASESVFDEMPWKITFTVSL